MTYYRLEKLATRICGHGKNTMCTCAGKTPSPSVQAYLDKAKQRLREGILYNPEWDHENSRSDKYRWVEHPSKGLRFVGKVHEIRGSGDGNLPYFSRPLIDHKGWYSNNYQDETVCGEVYQLPSRNGESLYVPAVSDPNNDAALLNFHSITSDLKDAIRWADHMAEKVAEDQREAAAKESAEDRIEEITSELKESRESLRALVRELKHTAIAKDGQVCKALRDHIRATRDDMRRLAKQRDKIQDNYWEATPNF